MKILILSRGNSYPRQEIEKAAKEKGHEVVQGKYRTVQFIFDQDFIVKTEEDEDMREFDAIVCRGPLNYRHIVQMVGFYAQKHNIFMLNVDSITNYPIFDKSVQYSLLSMANLPVIPALIDTTENSYEDLAKIFGETFVYKYTKGSVGAQVYKISSQKELDELNLREKRLSERYYMAQKFMPTGTDFRVAVIGGKVIGAMKRTSASPEEFRANYSLGGSVEAAEVSTEIKDIATKAAEAVKCDYLGVDVLIWEEKPHIIEVNRFFHFEGFDQANKTSVAAQVINYLEE